jgi:hypothetical protein
MKVTLPNGAIIETESESELSQLLGAMGMRAPKPENIAPKAGEKKSGKWTEQGALRFTASLQESSLSLLKLLLKHGDVTTTQASKMLNYTDNRPIGGIIGALRKRATAVGVECPVDSPEVDGVRRLVLDIGFREVAKGALTD